MKTVPLASALLLLVAAAGCQRPTPETAPVDGSAALQVVPGGGSWSSANTDDALSDSGTLSATDSLLGMSRSFCRC